MSDLNIVQLPTRVVAEVSKSWPRTDSDSGIIISQQFERVIAFNEERGYELESWKFSQVCPKNDQFIETIIAVFKKK